MTIDFKLPDLGESIEAGDVVSVLVGEGDILQEEQNVLELETEKAVVEVPCPHSGRVTTIHVKAGDRVAVGDPVLTLESALEGGKGASSALASAPAAGTTAEKPASAGEAMGAEERAASLAPAPSPGSPPAPAPPSSPESRSAAAPEPAERAPAPAGPATRRLARELGVDLHRVMGSGPGGRITREDVKLHVKQSLGAASAPGSLRAAEVLPELPELPDFARWGPVRKSPLGGVRRATAEAMRVAWRSVPAVTQHDEADITELEAARRRFEEHRTEGTPRVTVTAVALKACAIALGEFPRFRSSLDVAAGELILKEYCHIGVAVDTEHGLVVPVIRDVDGKSIGELAGELAALAGRARERKIALEEMRGGTFTVTNLGGIGGSFFTPIVNFPEVAILGMARARSVAVARGEEIVPRLLLPLSLSYDHRVIDGADGARFLRRLVELLEEPFRLLLET